MSLERSRRPEFDERTLPEQEYDGYAAEEQHERGVSDLVLDVPVLKIDELNLEVQDLEAHVSLRAELADLVKINVGVDVHLGEAKLEVKGVEAQALLTVRLERTLGTLNRALEAINRNPRILGGAVQGAGRTDRGSAEAGEPGATNAARRKADELGVELSGVRGTGSGGRILVKDVEKAAR